MSKNIKKNLPMLIALHCSSKAQKKELWKHLKPNTIKAICECTINIINRNIKASDRENDLRLNRVTIRELVNLKTSKKKRKEILVQEEGAFLALFHALVFASLMGPLWTSITGG